MEDEEIYCRLANYPKFIDHSSGVFSRYQFFGFAGYPRAKKTKCKYVSSVLSLHNEGDAGKIHVYGVKVANDQNVRRRKEMEEKGEEFKAEDETIYLGFYRIKGCSVENIKMNYYQIRIVRVPENDCDDHCHIEMKVSGNLDGISKRELRKDRFLAIDKLFVALYGPEYSEIGPAKLAENLHLLTYLPVKNENEEATPFEPYAVN